MMATNTALVADTKIYQSGTNVRQLLVDKRFSMYANKICNRTLVLKPLQGFTIPSCSFVHIHSNQPLELTVSNELGQTNFTTTLFTIDSEIAEIKVQNMDTAGATANVYVVYNATLEEEDVTTTYPYYYGCLENDPIVTEEKIKALTKVSTDKCTIVQRFTCEYGYPTVAIPKSWGPFWRIFDENGYNVTSNFTYQQMSIEVLPGVVVDYLVYVQETVTQIENFKFTFKYKTDTEV